MSDEILRYILKSKATRQMDFVLQALNQTDTGLLVIYVLIALTLCLFGHTFRRVLPFLIGLAAGFTFSCILNKLRISGAGITLEGINSGLSDFIARVRLEGSAFLKIAASEYGFDSPLIPAAAALVCGCLGALFYKFTMALFVGVLANAFAGIALLQSENATLYSVLIGAGSFILFLLLYHILFILLTAASGAGFIGLILTAKELVSETYVYVISGALCAIGIALQLFLFVRWHKRLKKKRLMKKRARAKQYKGKSQKKKSVHRSNTAA